MPVYNGERTIAGAINSILTQTYESWELIIINDGSTDNTENIIREFKDARIKYVPCSHGGIAQTRNTGNRIAKGKYCVVQDADDFSLPDRLQKITEAFKKTKADIIVTGAYVNAWNEQYQCIERRYSPPLSGKRNALENRINGWPAYKRGVWIKKPFREETKYAYDWMMNLDWTLSDFKYATLNEGLYEYVRYQGSASDRFEKSELRADAFKKIKEIVKNEYNETISIDSDGQLQKTKV